MKTADMIGLRFGRWTVKGRAQGKQRLVAECDCGVIRTGLFAPNLSSGLSKSCGCLAREQRARKSTTHGLSNSKEFWIWSAMRDRCTNPNNKGFVHYGGRGISVSPEWGAFSNFYNDMGPKPSAKHSLDRIDNNKGYCKGNCRWALSSEQSRNRRKTVKVLVNEAWKPLIDVCADYGINYTTFRSRCESAGLSFQDGVNIGLLSPTDRRTKEARDQRRGGRRSDGSQ